MVCASSIDSTAPEAVYRRIFNDLCIQRIEQNLLNIQVVPKFLPDSTIHQIAFTFIPIRVGLILTVTTNFCGKYRSCGGLNLHHQILKLCTLKLVCLIIVFDSCPLFASQLDRVWRKVRKATIGRINFVEINAQWIQSSLTAGSLR